ncbi:MAG: methyltransferase domain-containing protein [Chloroflexota bacterium]
MALSKYDPIADWYDETVRSSSIVDDLLLPPFLSALGNIEGQVVCDLACGQGRIARLMAKKGAIVIGIDISKNLLAIAQKEETDDPLGIIYNEDDAQKLTTIADVAVDQVICYLALMDIPDLVATFQAVWRILKPGRPFTCALTHPCFQTPHATTVIKPGNTLVREIQAYFDETYWLSSNPDGVRGKIGAYHRTLSTYLNTFILQGFQINQVLEPKPNVTLSERRPEYALVPPFIIIQVIK